MPDVRSDGDHDLVESRARVLPRRWTGFGQLAIVAAVVLVALYFMRAPTVAEFDYVVADGGNYTPQVEVAAPVAGPQTAALGLTGVVGFEADVRLATEVAGRVVAVSPRLRAGATFAAGEPLLTLDPSEHELDVRAAEALVRSQRERMRRHQLLGQRDSEAFERENPGLPVPPTVSRDARIARFHARTEAAEAQLDRARLDLARTRFSLPFDGRVVSTTVAVGELVGPVVSFGRAYARDAVNVEASIAVDDLRDLAPAEGLPVEVRVDGRSLPARVDRTSAVVSQQSRMATLYLKFDDSLPLAELPLPGMFAEMTILGRAFDGAFVLPDSARQADGSVWIVVDGALRQVYPAALGSNVSGWIVSAFDTGDGVVLGPVPGARTGLPVEVAGSSGS